MRPQPTTRWALLAFLAFLLTTAVGFGQEPIITGRCVAATDGDTIKVLTTEQQLLRVRIAFIDAPEIHQDFGYRAKQAMSAMAFGKEVELRPHAIDRYGRTVAVVYVSGVDAGLELLRQGLAWVYTRYLPEASIDIQASYSQAEALAREQQLGLWSDPEPVPPWEWRRNHSWSNPGSRSFRLNFGSVSYRGSESGATVVATISLQR
jgi:endonuclease YncB( thermonuclease family)